MKYSRLLLGLLMVHGAHCRAIDNSLIHNQFVGYHVRQPVKDAVIERDLAALQPDGAWSDIDYADRRRGHWETLTHLNRLVTMATAHADPESGWYRDPRLKDAVLSGLNHWIDKDYTNPNWWYGQIGIPENLLKTFLLLGDDLPEPMLKRAQSGILKRSEMGMTGQNKVWLAGIAFMKALLANDAGMMKTASDAVWSELRVSTEEGIQPDWSFHQHGPQQQFGNYGDSFGANMVMWGTILRGTEYAVSGEQLEILRHYLLEGPSWILWNGRMDLAGCGRQIDAGCQQSKARSIQRQLVQMDSIDPDQRIRYEAAGRLTGHKSYWRSDMAVHRRPDWYASVKMSSTRVIGAETCNSENMLGLHLGDGLQLTYLTGKEYEDIVPLWDWHRLPGTTSDQGLEDLTPKGSSSGYGGSAFAGVLDGGETGMAAMIYKRNGLEARKAWFFETTSVICLGVGITGTTEGPVYTSVQQSRMDGPVTTSSGTFPEGTHALKPGAWVHHAGIGYQLMEAATLMIDAVNGNWNGAFPTRGDRPVTGHVFSLWIDHGVSPKKQSYAYKIFPRTAVDQMESVVAAQPVKILSNTVAVQAVEGPEGVQAVFYAPGKLALSQGTVIEVSAPCMLMLRGRELIAAEPTHELSTVTVRIGGGNKVVKFPAGAYAGQQVIIQ